MSGGVNDRHDRFGHEFEGLDVDPLWHRARYYAVSAHSWIDDMPPEAAEIQTAKEDVLKALVALELAEERISKTTDTDQ